MASLLNEFLQAFGEKSIISLYGSQQFRTNAMNESKSDSDVEDTALVLTTDSIYLSGSNRT